MGKKVVLEFGERGGRCIDNVILPSFKTGAEVAAAITWVLGSAVTQTRKDWMLGKHKPRMTWTSATHYVALSVLDGEARGPASSTLWRKE